jgi:predicted GNAT family N-acyltransferase
MNQQEARTSDNEKPRAQSSLRRVGTAALTYAPEKIKHGVADIVIRRMLRTPAFEVKILDSHEDIMDAIGFEKAIWREEQYDDPQDYDYEKYTPQSRVLAAYSNEGDLIGMTRLFDGVPILPPFLEKLPIDDKELAKKLAIEASEYKAEEFGTVAVKKELRGSRIFMDLCRIAWRDATQRDVQTWGIIMEPERVEKMNSGLGFTFKQIGPAIQYQGGLCAAHIMDFDEVRQNMSSKKPELYDWFVNQPL